MRRSLKGHLGFRDSRDIWVSDLVWSIRALISPSWNRKNHRIFLCFSYHWLWGVWKADNSSLLLTGFQKNLQFKCSQYSRSLTKDLYLYWAWFTNKALDFNAVTKWDLEGKKKHIYMSGGVNDDGQRVNSGGLYVPQITPIITPIPPHSSYNVTDMPTTKYWSWYSFIFSFCYNLHEPVWWTDWMVEGQNNAHPASSNTHSPSLQLPP